jgi:uncharacterized protein YcnI
MSTSIGEPGRLRPARQDNNMTLARTSARFGAASVAVAGLALALSATAAAHVTVRPDVDVSGSYAKLTFRVPNESDSAGTVGLRVELPADTPFRSVRVQPHAGWTAELTRERLTEPIEVGDFTLDEIVTAVTWTADDGVQIGPDEFDEFAISVGPLPEPGDYPLPAHQTYSDGEVVAWADEPDADRPAPTLIVAAAADGDGRGQGAAPDGHDDEGNTTTSGSDRLARGLGVGGLALGAIGLGVGGSILRRTRA